MPHHSSRVRQTLLSVAPTVSVPDLPPRTVALFAGALDAVTRPLVPARLAQGLVTQHSIAEAGVILGWIVNDFHAYADALVIDFGMGAAGVRHASMITRQARTWP